MTPRKTTRAPTTRKTNPAADEKPVGETGDFRPVVISDEGIVMFPKDGTGKRYRIDAVIARILKILLVRAGLPGGGP